MSRKREYLLVIDTETTNSIEQPLPYDIGYVVCDKRGNIYLERSFIVSEIFLDMKDVMQSAFFADKIPQYWEDIKNGSKTLKSIVNIRKQLLQDMKQFKIKKVGGYNIAFDKKALNNLIRYCSKSKYRWWFPFHTDFFCIWNMACQVILNTTSYIKFAIQNNLISQANNIITNAQACYCFLLNSVNFIESHTALEDTKIEVQILAKCYATHKAMKTTINPNCWRIPQRKRKELELKEVFH